MSDMELQKIFNFDEGDLIENRAGRLSKKQEQHLKSIDAGVSKAFYGLAIFLILLGVLINYIVVKAIIGAESFENLKELVSQDFSIILPLCCPWGILGVFGYFFFWLGSKKTDYTIESVKGKVNLVKIEKSQSYTTASGSSSQRKVQQYEMRVGQIVFADVESNLLNIISTGDLYKVYYLKASKQILSCELISKAGNL